MSENIDVVLKVFRAVEQREPEALFDLYHREIEFHEAPSLPYGGMFRGKEAVRERALSETSWIGTWGPLQPTECERRMDPRVIAASDEEVVVLWRQRAVDPAGERFEGLVLGLYEAREGRLARAQMFHFDTEAVVDFLTKANRRLSGELA